MTVRLTSGDVARLAQKSGRDERTVRAVICGEPVAEESLRSVVAALASEGLPIPRRTPFDVAGFAAKASVSVPTARKFLLGEKVNRLCEGRCRATLTSLGLPLPEGDK